MTRPGMDDAEFGRLLQGHLFNGNSATEQQRLIAAVLASSERALEFAEVDDIREQLTHPEVRGALLADLPDVEPARRSWWSWIRPTLLVPVACGAVAALALLVAIDRDRPRPVDSAAPVPEATTAALPSEPPALAAPASGAPLAAAGTEASSDDGAALFAHVITRLDVGLGLDPPGRQTARTPVRASLELPADGHVYAFVRGPRGHVREVYPPDGAADVALAAGPLTFAFASAGRMDPPDGRSTLRIFFVEGPDPAPDRPSRAQWLAKHAHVAEVSYETGLE